MSWNQHREARFNELTASLKELEADRKAAVKSLDNFLDGMPINNGGYLDESSIEWLICKADALRDLLEPFDSGAREAKVTT